MSENQNKEIGSQLVGELNFDRNICSKCGGLRKCQRSNNSRLGSVCYEEIIREEGYQEYVSRWIKDRDTWFERFKKLQIDSDREINSLKEKLKEAKEIIGYFVDNSPASIIRVREFEKRAEKFIEDLKEEKWLESL